MSPSDKLTQLQDDTGKYLDAYFKIIHKQIQKLDKRINPKLFLTTLKNVYMSYDYRGFIRHVAHLPQDLYTLLRMFAQFDEHKIQRGPLGCRDTKYQWSKNIIVYTGIEHTVVYHDFLNVFGHVEPTHRLISGLAKSADDGRYYDDDQKCIKLPDNFNFWTAS
jgi:hypothetical protein